mmetsp:Transcript_76494/g.88935  ORF Transcript_76494/g.88935 Transcript_76494/m.88935 type:complete len:307 (+) Transcript_76494:25-945(+)
MSTAAFSSISSTRSSSSVLLSVHPENIVIVASPNGNHHSKHNSSGESQNQQPFNEAFLQLDNVTFKPVLFRIRTTAPKRYVVKPSKGVILPSASQVIQVTLVEKVETAAAACKDNFRLEYTVQHETDVIPSVDAIPDIIASRAKEERVKRDVTCVVRPPLPSAQFGDSLTEPSAQQQQQQQTPPPSAASAIGKVSSSSTTAPANTAADVQLAKETIVERTVTQKTDATTAEASKQEGIAADAKPASKNDTAARVEDIMKPKPLSSSKTSAAPIVANSTAVGTANQNVLLYAIIGILVLIIAYLVQK